MRIGFNLLVVDGHIGEGHAHLFERLKTLGYDGVEIPVFEGPVSHYEAVGRRLRSMGLQSSIVAIVTQEANPSSAVPAIRARGLDHLKWCIDCAHGLGADVMAGPFHAPLGVFTGNGPTETELDHVADSLREASVYAQGAGVKIAIEALNRFECYILNTMKQASDLRRRVGHPNFSYQYDTFHADIEERDPIAAYVDFAHEITHIHISENDRGIPGRGHVPFEQTIKAIRASGYDDWLTVESFGRSVPALAAATRVWRDLFPDLDTLFSESIDVIRRHWAQAA